MIVTKDNAISLEHVVARLHHDIRYFEPMLRLRESYGVSEGEALGRLASLYGYKGPEALPRPKSRYDLRVDERVVAWCGLEYVVFAFAHQIARLERSAAYYVTNVNPFLMGLDHLEEPRSGFVIPLSIGKVERRLGGTEFPFVRTIFPGGGIQVVVGVWCIECAGGSRWVFHGISGDEAGSFEQKVRTGHTFRIAFADETEMSRVAERFCREQAPRP